MRQPEAKRALSLADGPASAHTVERAIDAARARLERSSSHARRDAEILLGHVLGCGLTALLAHPERPLSHSDLHRYEQLVLRRAADEPIQYITGTQEFFGLPLKVAPGVLIPRPETEFLVETMLKLAENLPSQPRILDAGTGSGAIAIALAAHLPGASITAVDLSPIALEIAHENARAHRVAERIRFLRSDLLDALPGERFDAIAANLPYVSTAETLEPQVVDYEPHLAIFGGVDGLDLYRRLIPQASFALTHDGWLLVELGQGQREEMTGLLGGWRSLHFVADLQAIPRIACAQPPG